MNTAAQLKIVCDSREQQPFRFEGFPCSVEIGTLTDGDYSLPGFSSRIAVERKSLPDLVACLGVERERFARELARLRGYDAAAVVCESPVQLLRSGQYRSQMDAGAAWQTVIAFQQRYRIPFIFCESRADAERTVFDFLRHYHRDRLKELQVLHNPATTMPSKRTEGHRLHNAPPADGDAVQRPTEAKGESSPAVNRTVSKVLGHRFSPGTGAQSFPTSTAVLSRATI